MFLWTARLFIVKGGFFASVIQKSLKKGVLMIFRSKTGIARYLCVFKKKALKNLGF